MVPESAVTNKADMRIPFSPIEVGFGPLGVGGRYEVMNSPAGHPWDREPKTQKLLSYIRVKLTYFKYSVIYY